MPLSEPQQARQRYGAAVRLGNPEKITETRRDLAAAKLATYVERVLADAPPLTDQQRARIAGLLAPAGGDAR